MKLVDYLKMEEGKTLEFRRDLSGKKNILRTVSSFSNTSGGTILVGIDDSKTVLGLADPKEAGEMLSSIISDGISPQILPEIDTLSWRDRSVVRIVVYPGPARPYFLSGLGAAEGTYVRIGSTNRRADENIVHALERYSRGRTFDEEPVPDASSETIDFLAASELFSEYRSLKQEDLQSLRVVTRFMDRLVPTVGGILLFGKIHEELFPDAWLQCGRFRGKTKKNIIDNAEYRDYLPMLPTHAMEFLKKHMSTSITVGELRSTKRASFPVIALREAVINAVVHADYSLKGSPLRVSVFDDRIEIENPGLLQFGLTVKEMLEGVSVLRNRVIGRVFKEIGLIEQWGSGIQRMISECYDMGLPAPEFSETGRCFRVTVFTERKRAPELESVDSKIVNLLMGNPEGLSTSELAAYLGVTDRTIRNRMRDLVDRGYVVPLGTGPRDPYRKYILAEID